MTVMKMENILIFFFGIFTFLMIGCGCGVVEGGGWVI